MPIYEYQCESCEQRTEAIQRLDEPPLTICPHCGGPLVKLMSAPAFQFKGTGWYVTDYAGKGGARKKDGGDDSGSGAKDGGKDGAKGGAEAGAKGGKSDAGDGGVSAKSGKSSSESSSSAS